ncbi:hypothetical protein BN2475_1010004 [Paraburkholderia ribeironis]|uniref:Uncharacterized protein n=1 Tax=Paraburkholderia ribeironis TaxID=1247936 RepID=A0A1N7SLW6_9BURK|nr:hypothetical protein BN2475_1010004 [Paraburkholderia ribeironis]
MSSRTPLGGWWILMKEIRTRRIHDGPQLIFFDFSGKNRKSAENCQLETRMFDFRTVR